MDRACPKMRAALSNGTSTGAAAVPSHADAVASTAGSLCSTSDARCLLADARAAGRTGTAGAGALWHSAMKCITRYRRRCHRYC